MKFSYKALTESGSVEKGTIESWSHQEATRVIEQKGLIPVSLEVAEENNDGSGKIRRAEVTRFFNELSTLLRSGVPLVQALESQSQNQTNKALAFVLTEISHNVQTGQSFSEALSKAKRLNVPDYMLRLCEAGELTGKLSESIESAVDQMQYEDDLSSEIRNALAYPAVLVSSGILAIGIVFAVVVPKFTHLLDDDVDLPFLASFVLNMGVFMNQNWFVILLVCFLVVVFFGYQLSNSATRSVLLQIVARWPLVGHWLNEAESGRWTSLLSVLLASGVDLIKSLELASQGMSVNYRRLKMEAVNDLVRTGESLSEALENQRALTPIAYNMLRVGEQSGKLPVMLGSLAKLYEKNAKSRMKNVLIFIEPIAIILIGSVIGTIIVGIVLAITSSSDIPL